MTTIEEWDDYGYLKSIVIKETGEWVSFTTAKALEQYIKENNLQEEEYDRVFIHHVDIPFPEEIKLNE
ncbi:MULTISPECIES: SWIB-MDM2 domain-containing protein [Butyricimonas]|uniref:hypothetical protein n=1 Tax=Butyricimonas TaxID=574697 RepID=UPI0007FB4247|nr:MULTISPECIES: hypothetical protein [Butyricimonas]